MPSTVRPISRPAAEESSCEGQGAATRLPTATATTTAGLGAGCGGGHWAGVVGAVQARGRVAVGGGANLGAATLPAMRPYRVLAKARLRVSKAAPCLLVLTAACTPKATPTLDREPINGITESISEGPSPRRSRFR